MRTFFASIFTIWSYATHFFLPTTLGTALEGARQMPGQWLKFVQLPGLGDRRTERSHFNAPSKLARLFPSRNGTRSALPCAHGTSTVSSCAFCEQKDGLTAPAPDALEFLHPSLEFFHNCPHNLSISDFINRIEYHT